MILERPHHDIHKVFLEEKSKEHGFLRVSAPMVRYSKVEFRRLLRKHEVKLAFSPMIIADSFNNSEKARQNEFTTTADDQPVIAQFAAKDSMEFVNAAQLIYPYVDGIDLNCGCPQSWAIAKGYGCGLLKQPELVKDIIQTVKRTVNENFCVSLKIRLLSHENTAATIDFARQLEMCGASFLSLHGRTMWQKTSEPLNIPAIKDIKDSLRIPLIANGSVKTWQEACSLYEQTNADGIMAARGLLSNPALFNPKYKNSETTPLDCLQDWLDIGFEAGNNIQFMCFHHHLTFMLCSSLKKKLRLQFNAFSNKSQIYEFFEENYQMRPATLENSLEYTTCSYDHFQPESTHKRELDEEVTSWNCNRKGKFFDEFSKDDSDNLDLGNNLFGDM